MNAYNIYITLIIVIKVLFITMAVTHLYLKANKKENSNLDKNIVFWKERLEFVFIFLMALLLIYLFNPKTNRSSNLDYETKLLIYLFGFVLLITANWSTFIHESKFLMYLQKSLK
jgi:hypothetical protein